MLDPNLAFFRPNSGRIAMLFTSTITLLTAVGCSAPPTSEQDTWKLAPPEIIGTTHEVVTELRKVVWPSREDTTRMTIVTCIMLIISGIALGALDMVSGKLIEWLVNLDIVRFFSRIFGG